MVLIPVLYNNNQYNPTVTHNQSRLGNTRLPRNHILARGNTHFPCILNLARGNTHIPRIHTATLCGCRRVSGASQISLLRLWETPYATILVFPATHVSSALRNRAKAGIPVWLGVSNPHFSMCEACRNRLTTCLISVTDHSHRLLCA